MGGALQRLAGCRARVGNPAIRSEAGVRRQGHQPSHLLHPLRLLDRPPHPLHLLHPLDHPLHLLRPLHLLLHFCAFVALVAPVVLFVAPRSVSKITTGAK
jgi:hypothetical protein